MGEKFGKFKLNLTNLRATLAKSFNETMKSIQSGLTDIADEGNV